MIWKPGKDTDFEAKGTLLHLDGFLFLDHIKHEAFIESEPAVAQIKTYKERFGGLPLNMAADPKYGTCENH